MLSLSWKRYDDQFNLSELLTEAARACVDAWASNPGAFFASYFTKITTGDSVETLHCEKIFTPRGMLGLSLTICLFTNATATTSAFFFSEDSPFFGDGEEDVEMGLVGLPTVSSLGRASGSAGSPSSVSAPGVLSNNTTNSGGASSSTHHSHHAAVGGGSLHDTGNGVGGGMGALQTTHGTGSQTKTIKALHKFIVEKLLPELKQIPVSHQQEWDRLLETTRWEESGTSGGAGNAGTISLGDGFHTDMAASRRLSGIHGVTAASFGKGERGDHLPSSLRLCFSLSAAAVAAKSLKKNLYEHFRGLYAKIPRPPTALSGSIIPLLSGSKADQKKDTYTLPRLLLPFFGRSDAAIAHPAVSGGIGAPLSTFSAANTALTGGSNLPLSPPGSLCFHTFYLLPTSAASSSAISAEISGMQKNAGTIGGGEADDDEHRLLNGTVATSTNHNRSEGLMKCVGVGGGVGGNSENSPLQEEDEMASRGTNVMKSESGGDRGGAGRTLHTSPYNMKGILSEELFERLLAAYRLFNERMNRPPVRDDGAFVYANIENVVDAVQLASEVVQAAGLRPGKDVCFGMRIQCPVTRLSSSAGKIESGGNSSGNGGGAGTNNSTTTTSSSSGKSNKRGVKNAEPGKIEEVMYGLFSGDPEVSGAQVAEYLAEQVHACHGLLVFLEDTHDPQNLSGIHRLMDRLGSAVVVSGQGMYTPANAVTSSTVMPAPRSSRRLSMSPPPQSASASPPFSSQLPQQQPADDRRGKALIHKIECGVRSMWSHNITVPIRQVGTITRVMRVAMLLDAHSRCFTLLTRSDDRDLNHLLDLGVSISASFISMGGLNLSTTCDAVSYYIRMQEQLIRTRSLNDQPSIATLTAGISNLPPIPEEFVAEIKRKNDKKKKKSTKK